MEKYPYSALSVCSVLQEIAKVFGPSGPYHNRNAHKYETFAPTELRNWHQRSILRGTWAKTGSGRFFSEAGALHACLTLSMHLRFHTPLVKAAPHAAEWTDGWQDAGTGADMAPGSLYDSEEGATLLVVEFGDEVERAQVVHGYQGAMRSHQGPTTTMASTLDRGESNLLVIPLNSFKAGILASLK